MERSFLRARVVALGVLTCLGALAACGQSAPALKAGEVTATGDALVTGAQDEGSVMFYCSLTPASCAALGNGFEQKYPGVKVEVLRATSPDLSARYAAERKSRAQTADVILHADVPFIQSGLAEGLLTSFAATGLLPADYPREWVLESAGITGTPYVFEALGVGINTDLVAPQDYPKSWADLTDPRWKGRMNGPDRSGAGYATYYGTIDDHVDGFLEGLSTQQITPDPAGMVSLTESLAAGQYAIQTVASKAAIDSAKAKGAPVDIVFPEPGSTGPAFAFTLNPEPAHPHAQKLFAAFVVSAEADQLLATANNAIASAYAQPAFPVIAPNLDYYRPEQVERVADVLAGSPAR